MLYLDARIMRSHILDLKELHMRLLGCAVNLLGVNDKIHALNGNFVILLCLLCFWRCQFAHKAVNGQNQLHVEFDV